jgi:ABC transporter substrate binding protein
MSNRREFITLLGGSAVAWPLAARAQQAKLPTIGFLGSGAQISQRPWADAFVRRLNELGWIEGSTITIDYRWAEGRPDRFAEIAAEFVRLKVDLIYAVGTEATLAARKATSVIPIVFPVAGDPSTLEWWLHSRGRARTSPVCQTLRPISLLSGSKFYATFSQGSPVWRSWPTLAIPAPCWR